MAATSVRCEGAALTPESVALLDESRDSSGRPPRSEQQPRDDAEAPEEEAAQTAAMMRSELLLLDVQRATLRSRRLEMERERDDLISAALDRIQKFLPPRSTMTSATREDTRRDLDQAVTAHARDVLLAGISGVAMKERLRMGGRTDASLSEQVLRLTVDGKALSSLASALTVAPIADTMMKAEQRQRELWVSHDVLCLKEAVMCRRATAMLSELRFRMERRGELQRKRTELRRTTQAAVSQSWIGSNSVACQNPPTLAPAGPAGPALGDTTLSLTVSPLSPFVASSSSFAAAAAEPSINGSRSGSLHDPFMVPMSLLVVQRDELLSQWRRLRDVVNKRNKEKPLDVSVDQTSSGLSHRRDIMHRNGSSPRVSGGVTQTSSGNGLPWVVPEVFLVRREMVQFQ